MSEEKIISQGNIMHDSLQVIEYVVGDDSMSQGTHITVIAKTVISVSLRYGPKHEDES